MLVVYLVFILAVISTVRGIALSVMKKSKRDLLFAILPFPFFFCFFLGVISGGSAFNDAQNDYELYQAGHYYLESHGTWTEVSRDRYIFVFISEIIGFLTLAICFILGIIRDIKRSTSLSSLTHWDNPRS